MCSQNVLQNVLQKCTPKYVPRMYPEMYDIPLKSYNPRAAAKRRKIVADVIACSGDVWSFVSHCLCTCLRLSLCLLVSSCLLITLEIVFFGKKKENRCQQDCMFRRCRIFVFWLVRLFEEEKRGESVPTRLHVPQM